MSRKLLIGIVSTFALGASVGTPMAAAQALQFHINGRLAEASHQGVTDYGTITMKNSKFGEFKCRIVAGVPVWNEAEKGLTAFEGWEPYLCSAPECKGESFVTAEKAIELIEKENAKSEKEYTAKRGATTLPWGGELFVQEGATKAINFTHMHVFLNCPQEGLEVLFSGNLEPRVVNGLKNGLQPTHLVFEGKGGKTSWLSSPDICGGCESEEDNLYFSGELTMLGSEEQLITAE